MGPPAGTRPAYRGSRSASTAASSPVLHSEAVEPHGEQLLELLQLDRQQVAVPLWQVAIAEALEQAGLAEPAQGGVEVRLDNRLADHQARDSQQLPILELAVSFKLDGSQREGILGRQGPNRQADGEQQAAATPAEAMFQPHWDPPMCRLDRPGQPPVTNRCSRSGWSISR